MIFCWQDFIHIFSKGHNARKGHNPEKKKICVSYFFMRNPYMKFQSPSMHNSKLMLCMKKSAMWKCPKWQGDITWEVFFRIYSKVNQVIYSLPQTYSSNFKALASVVFEIFCWQNFIQFFSKGHNSGKGHNSDKNKNMCQLFCHEESIYEISKS